MPTFSTKEYDVEMQLDNDQSWKQKTYFFIEIEKLESKVMRDPVEALKVTSTFDPPKLSKDSIVPNIKRISVNHFDGSWKEWFRTKKFPKCEQLRIDCILDTDGEDDDHDSFDGSELWKYCARNTIETIFEGMETLKHLYLRCEIPYYDAEIFAPFNLESADVNYNYSFIKRSANTLKDLKVLFYYHANENGNLLELFTDYPKLEKLSTLLILMPSDEILRNPLPKKDTLKHLDIHTITDYKEEIDIIYLKHILASTPALEELIVYYEVTSDLVQFLARTLKKLKKVIARGAKGIAADVMGTLEDLKKTKDPNINANFEICFEMNRTWKKEFADFEKKGNASN